MTRRAESWLVIRASSALRRGTRISTETQRALTPAGTAVTSRTGAPVAPSIRRRNASHSAARSIPLLPLTPGWIVQFPFMDPDVQKQSIKRPNIGWITTSWNELDAPADSYDLIMLGQVYHDIILESGDFEALNQRFFRMLKPGGRLVIEDHDAIETMSLGEQVYLHRISHGDVTGQLLSAGFRQKDMILMKSGHDDRRFNVFRPTLRGRTDRFIAVFEKPLDGEPLR